MDRYTLFAIAFAVVVVAVVGAFGYLCEFETHTELQHDSPEAATYTLTTTFTFGEHRPRFPIALRFNGDLDLGVEMRGFGTMEKPSSSEGQE